MIHDRPLTTEERAKSQYNYNWFNVINGASYMCLGESVIVLFAIRLNMSNTVISLIGAMLFLGYLLLPLGVKRAAKVGAASCQADFWVCRNIAALLVALSIFVNFYSPLLAGITLLTGAFLFYGFRAAGIVLGSPMIGDITTEDDRSAVIGRSTALFYGSGAFALACISTILYFQDSVWILVGIIVAGASLGVTASTFVRNIDETSALRKSAQRPLFGGLPYLMNNPDGRNLAVVWFLTNLTNLLIIPISILTLKRGCGVSDTNAVIFSLIQFVIMIFASQYSPLLTKRLGPRMMILIACFCYVPTILFWICLPSLGLTEGWLLWCLMVIPFGMQGIASVVNTNSLIHYFLMTVEKEHQVECVMILNLITGAAAGIIGMGIAAGLMKLAELIPGSEGLEVFRNYFIMILLLFCGELPLFFRLKTVIHEYRAKHGEEATEKALERPHHKH